MKMYFSKYQLSLLDVQAGDLVSVYADVEGKCLRGYMKPFEGKKLFVGNGVMHVARDDIFRTDKKLG